ncbi:MAG: biotin/acetyl-CoA-carboxylase ligase [Chlorobi bacterium OLB5]|nr:MAG: biotin/acetyl-CoA-carboxylase ligase [Chlorobi bacterium OLB5]
MLKIESIKPELINSGFLRYVLYFDEIDSTNNFIKSHDIAADTLVISEYQLNGKGRNSSKWESEKHKNLTFSIKKDFRSFNVQNFSVLNYISYCIYITIKNIYIENVIAGTENNLWIKWPNDIYFGNKKLCGILSETKLGSGIFIIGAGINCNQVNFTENLNATSLKIITGKKINLNFLLLQLILSFSKNLNYLSSDKEDLLFKKWKNSTNMINKKCEFISSGNKLNSGIIKDLNTDGSILIKVNDEIKKFYSGELKLTSFN